MRLVGMQQEILLPIEIEDVVSPAGREYVSGLISRDETGRHVVVLLWYYIPPEDVTYSYGVGNRYEDLRKYANNNLRINVDIILDGLAEGSYRLRRYVVDETHSNGFTYRQQIVDACASPAVANFWLLGNNNYCASIDLEMVEERDGLRPTDGTLNLHEKDLAPWSVVLLDLQQQD